MLLIRHAKSSWEHPELTDHERPLANRGLRDAPEMGTRLKKRGIYPDLILTSDAVRAEHTALIIAERLALPKDKLKTTSSLYHSSATSMLSLVKNTSASIHTLFLVGHNPGMNDLIDRLGGENDNLPTAGLYGFIFPINEWKEASYGKANFWFMDFPKLKFPDIL